MSSDNNTSVMADEDKLASDICRESFYDFILEFWDTVVPEPLIENWHIKYLAKKLQKGAERVINRLPKENDLVVNIPPGMSKSTICSVLFPAWVWTRMPKAKIIGASYAYPLALDLSKKCRDVVMSEKYKRYFPEVEIRQDQNTKGYFQLVQGGMRYAVGSGGSVTGMHGDFIIIDDPADPNRVGSEAELKAINDWLSQTLSSRKTNRSISWTVLIMQRLSPNDPTNQFLERGNCDHVCLPADDSYDIRPVRLKHKYRSGLLDPNRLPRKVLNTIMKEMGEVGYAGQYGQAPTPPGGTMFKIDRIKRGTPLGTPVAAVRFWDKAATDGGKGAQTAGVLMVRYSSGQILIKDVLSFRLASAERELIILNTAYLDGTKVVVGIEQEGGSGGKESAQNSVRNLAGFRVRIVLPQGDKVVRADPFSVAVNNGDVFVPKEGDWIEGYLQELEQFPNGKLKDRVDASAGAYTLLVGNRRRSGGMRNLTGVARKMVPNFEVVRNQYTTGLYDSIVPPTNPSGSASPLNFQESLDMFGDQ